MARELDIAGEASLGGWMRWRTKHMAPVGTPCANCETPLQGAYCYNCGQLAEGFERSVWHLLTEAFESFFHFDGRLWQTLPKLAIDPGRLTREYLGGKRAYQIPPLRMFLVVLLVLFFVGGLALSGTNFESNAIKFNGELTPAQKAKLETQTTLTGSKAQRAMAEAIAKKVKNGELASINFNDDGTAKATAPVPGKTPTATADAGHTNINFGTSDSKSSNWLRERLLRVSKNRAEFMHTLEENAHTWAFLMLPVSALLLSVLFVFQRRFYVFDHLIFSMHSLSFQGLLLTLVMVLSSWGLPVGALMWFSPIHLFFHMRGAYRTSVLGTLLRMFLLFIGTCVAVIFMLAGLVWLSLATMA